LAGGAFNPVVRSLIEVAREYLTLATAAAASRDQELAQRLTTISDNTKAELGHSGPSGSFHGPLPTQL
jgi:hypothetical protein